MLSNNGRLFLIIFVIHQSIMIHLVHFQFIRIASSIIPRLDIRTAEYHEDDRRNDISGRTNQENIRPTVECVLRIVYHVMQCSISDLPIYHNHSHCPTWNTSPPAASQNRSFRRYRSISTATMRHSWATNRAHSRTPFASQHHWIRTTAWSGKHTSTDQPERTAMRPAACREWCELMADGGGIPVNRLEIFPTYTKTHTENTEQPSQIHFRHLGAQGVVHHGENDAAQHSGNVGQTGQETRFGQIESEYLCGQ